MKKKLVVTMVLLVLLAGGLGGFLLWKSMSGSDYAYDEQARNGNIEARSQDEIQKILNQQVEKGMFNVSINSNPVFENGSATGNLWIENVPNNTSDLKVNITLPQKNDENIFETKKIRPNQNIKDAKLDVKLAKGEYPAVAHFVAYDSVSGKTIGNADVNIHISVQN